MNASIDPCSPVLISWTKVSKTAELIPCSSGLEAGQVSVGHNMSVFLETRALR
ncbi:MAG: hypothetical protein ACI80V_003340 [Rhodothermales bacterium]|jgi:hypothetical protein